MSLNKKIKTKGITFAPFLKELNGHVKDYHASLQKLFEINGWESMTLVAQDCPLENLGPRWKKALYNPPKWSRRSFFAKAFPGLFNFSALYKLTRSFWNSLHTEIDPKNKTILFFETFNTFHLYALSFVLPFLPTKKLSVLILYRYDSKQLFFHGKRDRVLIKRLQRLLRPKHLALFADTEPLAQELSLHFKREVKVVPIPHTSGIESKQRETKKINLWWPGVPRRPKGLHLIQKLCHYSAPPNIEMYLAVSEKTPDLVDPESFRLEKISENLTREAYLKRLTLSDVILLPYNAWNYRYSSSGIFVESIFAKKMPVVTEGLWISEELKKHGLKDLIVDFNDPHLLYNIFSLYQNDKIHEKIAKMSASYQEYHSEDNFARLLQSYV